MTGVYAVSLLGLTVSGALMLVRLMRGPTAADRIVALDTLLLVVVGGVAVQIALLGTPRYAGILVVVSLLAFVGTVTVARFIERRESDR
ncbi:MAG: monovalent cation/H+ antiporter complex subunit F [Actinomycetota bacterium]